MKEGVIARGPNKIYSGPRQGLPNLRRGRESVRKDKIGKRVDHFQGKGKGPMKEEEGKGPKNCPDRKQVLLRRLPAL